VSHLLADSNPKTSHVMQGRTACCPRSSSGAAVDQGALKMSAERKTALAACDVSWVKVRQIVGIAGVVVRQELSDAGSAGSPGR
jgi:hypothetical protein